jgi:4a-hydroxytetrahydrobiopterin dehydratase
MERKALAVTELKAALSNLSGWEIADGRLTKTFKFGSFAEAIGWMVAVALYADKLDHHPDWSNVYNRVSVELLTHDMSAITTWDIALAERMDELAK